MRESESAFFSAERSVFFGDEACSLSVLFVCLRCCVFVSLGSDETWSILLLLLLLSSAAAVDAAIV